MNAAVNSEAELAFRFVSGHRALDLVSTLGNRHRQPVERLREPTDLDRWLTAAGLALNERATTHELAIARALRETLNRLARALIAGDSPRRPDVAELNDWARRPTLAPQLDRNLTHRWAGEQPVQAALALIARETVLLLIGPERSLIRECAAAPNCSLLYLDRSPARQRRWCEMERCGSREKMAHYRARHATRPAPTEERDATPT
jgi:predicted RNA-binding Zn ribbon-like protein